MTPAEQAAILWEDLQVYWASNDPDFAVKLIAQAIEQARRDEREACAKIALHWYDLPDEITDQAESHTVEGMIAAAIRARARGCTLPRTHGAEPHSWEHPTHDAPMYEPEPPAPGEGAGR